MTQRRYVNRASTAGGDGTTNATAGATRAYFTLAEAVAAMPSPLTEDWILECTDGGAVAADTTAVALTGKDLATFQLTIRAAVRDQASTLWSTAKYRFTPSVNNNGALILVAGNVALEGLQIENTAAAGDDPEGVRCVPGTGIQSIDRCFIRHAANTNGNGITNLATTGFTVRVRNTIVQGFNRGAHQAAYTTSGTWVVYNTLFTGQGLRGLDLVDHDNANKYIKNVAVQGTPSDACIVGVAASANVATVLTEDATSPTVALRNKAITFVDEPGGDFALADADTAARNVGTDLTLDETWPFSTDIKSTPRIGAWDIGPHENPWANVVAMVATGLNGLGAPVAASGGVWTSTDESVARVSATGLVTAIAAGQCEIRYTKHGIVGTAVVTVQ